MAGCPSSHQTTRIREETLGRGTFSAEVEFPPPYIVILNLSWPKIMHHLGKVFHHVSEMLWLAPDMYCRFRLQLYFFITIGYNIIPHSKEF